LDLSLAPTQDAAEVMSTNQPTSVYVEVCIFFYFFFVFNKCCGVGYVSTSGLNFGRFQTQQSLELSKSNIGMEKFGGENGAIFPRQLRFSDKGNYECYEFQSCP